MTIQEFKRRWFLIDDTIMLEMSDNNRMQTLDDKRTKLVLRVLGLNKEPVPVPNRSLELAKDQVCDDKKYTGVALDLLSILAEYKDPIRAAQIAQLGTFNQGTMSSRLSILKSEGLISAVGSPSEYMLTGKGHAALIHSANRTNGEGTDG